MTNTIIGVDLGGTRVRAARLDQHLRILERHETLTRAREGLEPTLERIKDLIERVMPEDRTQVAGIGVSAPGPLNPRTGTVIAPPNLPGWHRVSLGDILKDAFDLPVYVGNDANVAALAETARGGSQGYRHVIYITVSTGIGSGVICDGRLLLGQTGLAAEAGHMILVTENGRVSSLEKEAAGPAMARKMRARVEAGAYSSVTAKLDGDLSRLDARMVGEAAAEGDPLALEMVRHTGRTVGLGIVTLLHLFNPEVVVVGGGVSNVGELLFDPMREAVRQHALDSAYWEDLKIVHSVLNEDVSIIGAAVLVVTRGGMADINEVLELLQRGEMPEVE